MASFQDVASYGFMQLTNNFTAHFPTQNYIQLTQQKHKSKKIHKYKFTKEEDEKLCLLVKRYGENNWALISKNMKNRNARQCRERWKNYMNPKLIKNEWTEDDDLFLLKKYQEIGPHWNKITQYFHNRSSNSVRNRFVKLYKAISNKAYVGNNNAFDMNNQIHPESIKIAQQNNLQSFPFIQNNFIMYHQQYLYAPINTFSFQHSNEKRLAVSESSPTKKQSSNIIDERKSKIPNATTEKKDIFDIFWDQNKEIDLLSSCIGTDY